MKKIEVKPLNLEIVTKSPVLDIRYDKLNEKLVFDIDQQELNHKYLQGTGGDPHPQYLDMIRHRGMDHTFLIEHFDKLYLHSHEASIKYFFERYDVNIEPGCFGYTILPCCTLELTDVVISSRKAPTNLVIDVRYNNQSLLLSPITEAGSIMNFNGVELYEYSIPDITTKLNGAGLLEVIVIEAEDVGDLLFRIEFK